MQAPPELLLGIGCMSLSLKSDALSPDTQTHTHTHTRVYSSPLSPLTAPLPSLSFPSSQVPDDRGGFVGWQGYGGTCLQFHPDPRLAIGFGFASNVPAIDLSNAAITPDGYMYCELQRAVLDAAKATATRGDWGDASST